MRSDNEDDSESDVHGEERSSVCLACLRSALAGRSDGRCYDIAVGRSSRCERCHKQSHACRPIPEHVLLAARKFFQVYWDERASGMKEVCSLMFPCFLSLILTLWNRTGSGRTFA
jgi:hypothetical protein